LESSRPELLKYIAKHESNSKKTKEKQICNYLETSVSRLPTFDAETGWLLADAEARKAASTNPSVG